MSSATRDVDAGPFAGLRGNPGVFVARGLVCGRLAELASDAGSQVPLHPDPVDCQGGNAVSLDDFEASLVRQRVDDDEIDCDAGFLCQLQEEFQFLTV
ncbi:hypothetical protein LZK73_05335 [Neorhizobium galegae]|nr:hypothetical protein LZK73_05335 [Neorhizobium galegae]